jgi:hypothetical protein
MTDEQLKQFREHTLAALKKIPNSRWYALDETALDSLANFGIAWLEERVSGGQRFDPGEFEKIIGDIVEAEPSLRQERPSDPKPPPKPWVNPLTGQPVPPPKGIDEKGVLAERDPELLAFLEAFEKKPYQTLAALQDAEAARVRNRGDFLRA